MFEDDSEEDLKPPQRPTIQQQQVKPPEPVKKPEAPKPTPAQQRNQRMQRALFEDSD
ncbi:unnamed protein product [Paramecium octaurelia]|uniref:Uncharacterized protein n=1 Tax=Paramecium octaurelia TaxID=43137 RepID=A0A8S1TY31_PAROT|nr:unnamed protein product [Paramecium octaurelia]